jgi:hypothetical protein
MQQINTLNGPTVLPFATKTRSILKLTAVSAAWLTLLFGNALHQLEHASAAADSASREDGEGQSRQGGRLHTCHHHATHQHKSEDPARSEAPHRHHGHVPGDSHDCSVCAVTGQGLLKAEICGLLQSSQRPLETTPWHSERAGVSDPGVIPARGPPWNA